MKRLLPILLVAATACGTPDESSDLTGLARFLALGPDLVDSADARRDALEASLVDPSNGYSQLRLENYGVGGSEWDTLPMRNFAVRSVTNADIGTFTQQPYRRSTGDFAPTFAPEAFDWTHESLIELGRRAFHTYPLELATRFIAATESAENVAAAGLWSHNGRVGGLVRVRLNDGSETFSSTCSTCHASVVDGELVDGRTNPDIDNSAMSRRYQGLHGSDWGPGRVDVTADQSDNPVAIPDIRPIRHQKRLHWAATLHNSPEALAVRIETLMITSANQAMRPPREVSVALAYYFWSLGSELPEIDDESPGAQIFEAQCSGCHWVDGTTADPVPIESIGTDAAVGLSTTRGTGTYRIPSLHRVSERSQFLHEGKVKSIEELFDAARLHDVPGHVYGTTLSELERSELLAFLEGL